VPTSTIPQNRLKELRLAQQQKRHHISAIVARDTVTVSRWEAGTTPIPPKFLKPLAEHFDVRVGYLAGWEDKNGKEAA